MYRVSIALTHNATESSRRLCRSPTLEYFRPDAHTMRPSPPRRQDTDDDADVISFDHIEDVAAGAEPAAPVARPSLPSRQGTDDDFITVEHVEDAATTAGAITVRVHPAMPHGQDTATPDDDIIAVEYVEDATVPAPPPARRPAWAHTPSPRPPPRSPGEHPWRGGDPGRAADGSSSSASALPRLRWVTREQHTGADGSSWRLLSSVWPAHVARFLRDQAAPAPVTEARPYYSSPVSAARLQRHLQGLVGEYVLVWRDGERVPACLTTT